MIFGCVIFYDDEPDLLEKCLMSLKVNSIPIIAIDGTFTEFPHTQVWSKDRTRDIAVGLAEIFIPACLDGWQDQMTKRNVYLDIIRGHYAFVLDADEELIQWVEPDLTEDFYAVKIQNEDHVMPAPRLFRVSPQLCYMGKHYTLMNGDKIACEKYDNQTMSDIVIKHHKRKDINRTWLKNIYYGTRSESPFKQRKCLCGHTHTGNICPFCLT